MPPGDATPSSWIAVAQLLRPQGRRGELLSDPLSDLEGIFVPGRRFRLVAAPGPARPQAAGPREIELQECWKPQGRNAGRLVLKLAGVDSISAAEALCGAELQLENTDLPALPEDTFLVRDLLGCVLFDNGKRLGTVTDLHYALGPDGRTRLDDAADLLVVTPVAEEKARSPHVLEGQRPPTAGVLGEPSPQQEKPQAVGAQAQTPLPVSTAQDAETVLVPFVKAWLDVVDIPGKRIHMRLPPGLFDDATMDTS